MAVCSENGLDEQGAKQDAIMSNTGQLARQVQGALSSENSSSTDIRSLYKESSQAPQISWRNQARHHHIITSAHIRKISSSTPTSLLSGLLPIHIITVPTITTPHF
jgi:hypothetical protein